jgi:hypothetical protein
LWVVVTLKGLETIGVKNVEYITCKHPKARIEIRVEKIKPIDLVIEKSKPRPFCTNCKSYLPVTESPGKEIVSFWFIRQDGKVKAMARA